MAKAIKEREILVSIYLKINYNILNPIAKGKGGDGKGGEEEKTEAAPKFDEQDIAEAIKFCQSFDEDQLSYVDFLEALVRVTEVYPFSEMQKAEAGVLNFENKVNILVEKLGCFGNLKKQFEDNVEMRKMAMGYVARVVIDEEMSDDGE